MQVEVSSMYKLQTRLLIVCVCSLCLFSEKVVSAALLQIFGRQIAEVPLIATSLAHQGQVFSLNIFFYTFQHLCFVMTSGVGKRKLVEHLNHSGNGSKDLQV